MNSLVSEDSWNNKLTLKSADETLLSQLFSRSNVSITWKKKKYSTRVLHQILHRVFYSGSKISQQIHIDPQICSLVPNGERKKRETLIGCTNFYSFCIIDTEELVSNLIIDKYYWHTQLAKKVMISTCYIYLWFVPNREDYYAHDCRANQDY